MTVDSETPIVPKQKTKGGRPLGTIWEDINQGKVISPGKFSASCKYCEQTWNRGEISKLEEHLSNHCQRAPANVVRKYITKVLECQDKSTNKKESSRVVDNKVFTIIMTQQIFPSLKLHELIVHWLNILLHVEYHSELLNIRSS
jgi:hypothetical protein